MKTLDRFLRAVAWTIIVWLGLAIVLGVRKWGCDLPWSQECVRTFMGHLETIVLFTWVTDRETMVAGMMAVAAAGVSVIYLRRQTSQAQAQEKRRLRRKHRAAKAVMPNELSNLCGFLTESARRYDDCLRAFHVDRAPDVDLLRGIEAPLLAPSVTPAIQSMIASSPRQIAEPFIHLLAHLQVHQTRWQGFENAIRGRSRMRVSGYVAYNLQSEIVEAAEIYANTTDLFGIVRPYEHTNTEMWDRQKISSALRLMGFFGRDELIEIAETREPKRPPSTVPRISPPPRQSSR